MPDRHVRGELPRPGVPRAEDVDAGLLLEPLRELVRCVAREEVVEVIAVVENKGAIHDAHRSVDRAQG